MNDSPTRKRRQCTAGTARLTAAASGFTFLKICLSAVWMPGLLIGCRAAPYNRLNLIDYRSDRSAAHHFEDFDDACYRINDDGLADILLRKQFYTDAQPHEAFIQIVHLRTYWKPIPGRTFAEESMINTSICYAILQGGSAVSYDGGGFVHYRVDDDKGTIRGRLQGAMLQPLRQVGSDLAIFERVTVDGRFLARRDDRRATRLINEVERQLGPLPAIEPPTPVPDY